MASDMALSASDSAVFCTRLPATVMGDEAPATGIMPNLIAVEEAPRFHGDVDVLAGDHEGGE